MEDPAEIASLAQEFISSLDNLPQEVGHLMSEIQHKEDKIADLLPRIANREAQVRDIITKGGANLINPGASVPESDRAKLEKLHDRIKTDFDRVGELSRQKEDLAIQLWRDVFTHHARLKAEMEKIAPHVLESFTANDVQHPLPTFAQTLPTLTALKSGADPDAMFSGCSGRIVSRISSTRTDSLTPPAPVLPLRTSRAKDQWTVCHFGRPRSERERHAERLAARHADGRHSVSWRDRARDAAVERVSRDARWAQVVARERAGRGVVEPVAWRRADVDVDGHGRRARRGRRDGPRLADGPGGAAGGRQGRDALLPLPARIVRRGT